MLTAVQIIGVGSSKLHLGGCEQSKHKVYPSEFMVVYTNMPV